MSYKLEITLKDFNFKNFSHLKLILVKLKKYNFFNQINITNQQLPTSKKLFTVLKSPHVYKKSREQFQFQVFQRKIIITHNTLLTLLYIDIFIKQYLIQGATLKSKLSQI